jgi:hypothetical protein
LWQHLPVVHYHGLLSKRGEPAYEAEAVVDFLDLGLEGLIEEDSSAHISIAGDALADEMSLQLEFTDR